MPEISILPHLIRWFAEEPLLCFGIVACICAAIYGLFTLDQRSGAGLISGDFDGDD